MTRTRRIFVSETSGPVGGALLRLAGRSRGLLVPHDPSGRSDPEGLVFDLRDRARLETELRSCTSVILIPDHGEFPDLDGAKRLVEAAVAARIDHFILLSASGAGRPLGGYLKSRARAEAALLSSSLRYTIVRPALSEETVAFGTATALRLSTLMGRRSLRSVGIEDVALTLLDIAVHQSQLGAIIEGEELWKAIAEARSHARLHFATP